MVAAYLAELFESHRPRLLGLGYRLTGSTRTAEDALQECLLRLNGVHQSEIDDLGAWLTATVARICADHLVAAERGAAAAQRLPDPLVTPLVPNGGGEWAAIAGRRANRLTTVVALAALTPAQRLAAVLPDLPAEELATWLDLDTAAAARAAAIGRAAAAALPGPAAEPAHEAAVRRLLTALRARARAAVCEGAESGCGTAEVADELHANAQALTATPDGPVVTDGAERVATRLLALAAENGIGCPDADPADGYEFAAVNGELGLLLRGRQRNRVLAFAVRDDAVWRVFDLAAPNSGWS
ncbi:sigma factor [Nocardia sp. NPDC050697]|uniref:sigma factor n=1 Tax=Nocardia sp. NPDC050697 TaxID=3155158 RepID=UPI0033CE525D